MPTISNVTPSRHLPPSRALREPDRHAAWSPRGEIIAVFNEERFPFHHDSGQTLLTRSRRWRRHLVGAGDRAALDRHHRQLGLRLLRARRRHLAGQPDDHRLLQARRQARRRVVERPSDTPRNGATGPGPTRRKAGSAPPSSSRPTAARPGAQPIPVNVRPLKHGGCRLGCWQLPSGSLLMGLYGRIHGYEEEGEGEIDPLGADALRRRRRQLGVLLDPRLRSGLDHRLRGAGAGPARRTGGWSASCARTSTRRATPRTW